MTRLLLSLFALLFSAVYSNAQTEVAFTCPDLTIDTFKVLDISKNKLSLILQVKNNGSAVLDLQNGKSIKLAFQLYSSPEPELNDKAVMIANKGIKDLSTISMVSPGNIGILKIDTKFEQSAEQPNYIIVKILTMGISECDENNNTISISRAQLEANFPQNMLSNAKPVVLENNKKGKLDKVEASKTVTDTMYVGLPIEAMNFVVDSLPPADTAMALVDKPAKKAKKAKKEKKAKTAKAETAPKLDKEPNLPVLDELADNSQPPTDTTVVKSKTKKAKKEKIKKEKPAKPELNLEEVADNSQPLSDTTVVKSKNKKVKKEKVKKEKPAKPEVYETQDNWTAVYYDEGEGCPDLRIDSVVISKFKRKKATVTLYISNVGEVAANLYGTEKGYQDNVAWRGFLSGDRSLNKGDIMTGGGFLVDLPNDGKVEPNTQIAVKVEVDMPKYTRYTPILVMRIDAFQTLRECSEMNNNASVILR
jgi:hypothetical protein